MDAFPGDARALTSLSDLLLGAELYEEAAAILGGVVKSNPQNYHIRTLYARTRMHVCVVCFVLVTERSNPCTGMTAFDHPSPPFAVSLQ